MKAIIDLKDKDDLPEILSKKVFVLTMKWKKEIEDWIKNPRPPLPIHPNQETPNKDPNLVYDESLNRKRNNPKYLENESDDRKEKFFDKNKIDKKDKNKKKVKYERKKESHHHSKPREKDSDQKNSSNGKYQRKKDYFKRTKNVKSIIFLLILIEFFCFSKKLEFGRTIAFC